MFDMNNIKYIWCYFPILYTTAHFVSGLVYIHRNLIHISECKHLISWNFMQISLYCVFKPFILKRSYIFTVVLWRSFVLSKYIRHLFALSKYLMSILKDIIMCSVIRWTMRSFKRYCHLSKLLCMGRRASERCRGRTLARASLSPHYTL